MYFVRIMKSGEMSNYFKAKTEEDCDIWLQSQEATLKFGPKDSYIVESGLIPNRYRTDRQFEYLDQGLVFERFIELMIEGDDLGMQEFRQKRQEIKSKYPKN